MRNIVTLILFSLLVNSGIHSEAQKDVDDFYREISADEAARLIEDQDLLLLDVRTPGEYEEVHIPDSMLIPLQVLPDNLADLSGYENKPILVYCRSGNRSTVASNILRENGFKQIYNLSGGIGAWIRRGFETEY